MRLITEPRVWLVGIPHVTPRMLDYVKWKNEETPWWSDSSDSSQFLCETMGRICYDSFSSPRPGGNKTYLANLLKSGHGSCIEHSFYSFIISDISRSCSHELVRHRHFSFSQRSQRYVDESQAGVVIPPELRLHYAQWRPGTPGPFESWYSSVSNSLIAYCRCVRDLMGNSSSTEDRKKVRQTARSLLPSCVATEIGVTMNARAARNFLELRCSRHADTEIRQMANRIYECLNRQSPHLFGDYEKTLLPDETYELQTEWRKV